MEYVNVRFAQPRIVYIDGQESGTTNGILRIGTGTHLFDLGTPNNYQPPEIIVQVYGSNPLEPIIVEFKPLPQL